MSYRVLITDRALEDLREIRDYIAKRSPDNAADFLGKILGSFDVIESSPGSYGKAREDELVPYTLHQYIVKPYRILYRVEGKAVHILHVRHGARKPATPEDLV
jgi:toxin ParE1/3/4